MSRLQWLDSHVPQCGLLLAFWPPPGNWFAQSGRHPEDSGLGRSHLNPIVWACVINDRA